MSLYTSSDPMRSFRRPKTMIPLSMICCVRHQLKTTMKWHAYPVHTDESALRRRIQELQHYRRLGITSSAEIEKYENELYHRVRIFSFLALSLTEPSNRTLRRQTRASNETSQPIGQIISTGRPHAPHSLLTSQMRPDEAVILSHPNPGPQGDVNRVGSGY